MAHVWTLMSAGLLVLCAAERLNSPEENEVLKHTAEEHAKKQASGSLGAWVCTVYPRRA